MLDISRPACRLAGFTLAHAVWSVSDLRAAELLCPLTMVEEPDGDRRLMRFIADTEEEAILQGKGAGQDAARAGGIWAFAWEGHLRGPDAAGRDVVTVDFGSPGMAAAVSVCQEFRRRTWYRRFRVTGDLTVLLDGHVLDAADAGVVLSDIREGIAKHPQVCVLWKRWV